MNKRSIAKPDWLKVNRQECLRGLFVLILLVFADLANAQNCSVNAGVTQTICKPTTDTFRLNGNTTGLIGTAATWSQVSGPSTTTIVNNAALNSQVTNYIIGTYTYKISAVCQDGTPVSQNVNIVVKGKPLAYAPDTTVCGTTVAYKPNYGAALASGETAFWYSYGETNLTGIGFSNNIILAPTISAFNSGGGIACDRFTYAVLRVDNGACINIDTAKITFKYQTNFNKLNEVDRTVCGTSTSTTNYQYGCGSTISAFQLSGPSAATITETAPGTTNRQLSFSNLIQGTYVFGVNTTTACGVTYKDTFNAIVYNLPSPTPVIAGMRICENYADTMYKFMNTAPLKPGESAYWDLKWNSGNAYSYSGEAGSTAYNCINPAALVPVQDTTGGVLKVTHFSRNVSWLYHYYTFAQYVITNGFCTVRVNPTFIIDNAPDQIPFVKTIVLPCGTNTTNIAQLDSAGMVCPYLGQYVNGQNYNNVQLLSKPAGSTPVYSSTSSLVGGLSIPGTYMFSFDWPGNGTCKKYTYTIQVVVSGPAALSNAGTDQILACGVDSSVLAGNSPASGNGYWEQVSGPSTVLLANPTNPSLKVKYLISGTYTFRWTIRTGPGCAQSDEMQVFVTLGKPTSKKVTKNICYGMPLVLNGTPLQSGWSGTWTKLSGPAATLSATNVASPTLTGTIASSTYVYRWSVSTPCGTVNDTFTINTGASQGPSVANITTADLCLNGSTGAAISATTPTSGSGRWSLLSGPSSVSFSSTTASSTSLSNMTGLGMYKILWSVSNGAGCDTLRDTIMIARMNGPIATPTIATYRTVCKSDTAKIGVTTAFPGHWTQTQGSLTTIQNTSATTTKVYVLNPGVYQYSWTVDMGACAAPAPVTTTLTVYDSPGTPTILTNDTLICGVTYNVLTSKIFSASSTAGAGTGIWSVTNTSFPVTPTTTYTTSAASNPVTLGLRPGMNYVVYSMVNGQCVNADTAKVEIVAKSEAGSNMQLCNSNFLNYAMNFPNAPTGNWGTSTGTWSQRSGPTTAVFTDVHAVYPMISNLLAGRYVFDLTMTHPVCGSTKDSMVVNVGTRPVVNGMNDTIYCLKTPTTDIPLKGSITGTYSSVSWTRTTTPGGTLIWIPNSTTLSTTARVNTAGIHQFTLTGTYNGCSANDIVTVLVQDLPKPSISLTSASACADTLIAGTSSLVSNYRYTWYFQDAKKQDTTGVELTGPLKVSWIWPSVGGIKKIKLTMTNPVQGCKSSDSTTFLVNCVPLSLDWISFKASLNRNNLIGLIWNIRETEDIKEYRIERWMSENVGFEEIGKVKAIGVNNLLEYRFEDIYKFRANEKLTYRIKAIRNNARFSYSPVQQLSKNTSIRSFPIVYPNPAGEVLNVNSSGEVEELSLISPEGRVCLSVKNIAAGLHTFSTAGFAPGIYGLRMTINGVSTTQKWVLAH